MSLALFREASTPECSGAQSDVEVHEMMHRRWKTPGMTAQS